MRPPIRVALLTTVLLSAAATPGRGDDPGEDLITLRDGGTKTGKVESCDGAGCLIGGNQIARATIMSIRLGRQGALNLQDPTQDKVQLTDGSVLSQTMTGVDAARVASNRGSFPRGQVAWIYLAAQRATGAQVPRHWQGTLVWSARDPVPSGPQDWDGKGDLTLDSDESGGVTGLLTGTQTQTLGLARCHATTNGTVKIALTGGTDRQRLKLTIADAQAVWPELTPCQEGNTAHTGAPVTKWPHFAEIFQNLSPASDGGYHYEREWTVQHAYTTTFRYVLDLRARRP
jgi:hypothetical protein